MNTDILTEYPAHFSGNHIAARLLNEKTTRKVRRGLLAALFGLGLWQCAAMLVYALREIYFPTPPGLSYGTLGNAKRGAISGSHYL